MEENSELVSVVPKLNKKVKKSLRGIIILFFIAFIVGVAGFLAYLKWMLESPSTADSTSKIIEVKKGESSFEIASALQEMGIVKSDWVFFLNAKMKGKVLSPGIYEIPSNLSMDRVYEIISNGETKIVKVTIPEGYRVDQIAQVLLSKNLVNYMDFVGKATKYEGELFPDTYYFSPDKTVDGIISEMHRNYLDRTADLNVSKENLIIASIVEREAIKDEERPLIAGIYKNRIARGMKFEADPTVQYGKDNQTIAQLSSVDRENYKFWKPITISDYLKVDSVYNTYIISGLPPAPICNPGIKSIRATINYQKSDYIFFLQNDGKIYPAVTLKEHNQNRVNILGARL